VVAPLRGRVRGARRELRRARLRGGHEDGLRLRRDRVLDGRARAEPRAHAAAPPARDADARPRRRGRRLDRDPARAPGPAGRSAPHGVLARRLRAVPRLRLDRADVGGRRDGARRPLLRAGARSDRAARGVARTAAPCVGAFAAVSYPDLAGGAIGPMGGAMFGP
jgi:hypothetical protein